VPVRRKWAAGRKLNAGAAGHIEANVQGTSPALRTCDVWLRCRGVLDEKALPSVARRPVPCGFVVRCAFVTDFACLSTEKDVRRQQADYPEALDVAHGVPPPRAAPPLLR